MVGQGAFVNTFLEYDSKLTGGACFIPLKAPEAPEEQKKGASATLGMPFFRGCLSSCQKVDKENELVFDTKDD